LDACLVVRDHSGHQLAYVYFVEEPGRRSAAKLLIKRRGAANRGEYREAAASRRRGLSRSHVKAI
jgi:hypothetical protein